MDEIRSLVMRLPECAPKAALRGILAAATADETPEAQALDRMASVARQWFDTEPLTVLVARLEQARSTAHEA